MFALLHSPVAVTTNGFSFTLYDSFNFGYTDNGSEADFNSGFGVGFYPDFIELSINTNFTVSTQDGPFGTQLNYQSNYLNSNVEEANNHSGISWLSECIGIQWY